MNSDSENLGGIQHPYPVLLQTFLSSILYNKMHCCNIRGNLYLLPRVGHIFFEISCILLLFPWVGVATKNLIYESYQIPGFVGEEN